MTWRAVGVSAEAQALGGDGCFLHARPAQKFQGGAGGRCPHGAPWSTPAQTLPHTGSAASGWPARRSPVLAEDRPVMVQCQEGGRWGMLAGLRDVIELGSAVEAGPGVVVGDACGGAAGGQSREQGRGIWVARAWPRPRRGHAGAGRCQDTGLPGRLWALGLQGPAEVPTQHQARGCSQRALPSRAS